eukprot:scaffold3515_cov267-Chaetoceros_neogracile.AAC.2
MQDAHEELDDLKGCDRRRSRAARSLLMNKTIPILQYYSNYPLPNTKSDSESDYMQSYKIFISDLMTNPSKCILNPKSDMYWHEELQYSTQSARNQKQKSLHKCGTCGKTFLSRFYLDQHMEHKHDLYSNHNHHIHHHRQERICPANGLCNLLGGSLCDRQALNDEPLYASGIYDSSLNGKLSAKAIQRKYQNQIDSQPCDTKQLQKSREFCRDSIITCFAGMDDLMTEMNEILCETHNCRHHLDTLHSAFNSVHDMKGEWDRHIDELNRWGWGFILFSLFGLTWILWNHGIHWIKISTRGKGKGRHKKRQNIDMSNRKEL